MRKKDENENRKERKGSERKVKGLGKQGRERERERTLLITSRLNYPLQKAKHTKPSFLVYGFRALED